VGNENDEWYGWFIITLYNIQIPSNQKTQMAAGPLGSFQDASIISSNVNRFVLRKYAQKKAFEVS
jgi:hypothetical protein